MHYLCIIHALFQFDDLFPPPVRAAHMARGECIQVHVVDHELGEVRFGDHVLIHYLNGK